MSSNNYFLSNPISFIYFRFGYPALLFIDTEVILLPKTSPLFRSRPDFGNPFPIEIDAVKGVDGWVRLQYVIEFKL